MNNWRWSIFIVFVFLDARGLAEDKNTIWMSPSGEYQIVHHPTDQIFRVNTNPDPWAYVLLNKQSIIWAGLSFVDESAHEFQVLWSPGSKGVLILDRPDRAECEGVLFNLGSPFIKYKFNVQALIDRTFHERGDTNDRVLQKAWFEGWRWNSDSVVRGEIHCAKEFTHTLVVEFDLRHPNDGLKLISEKRDR